MKIKDILKLSTRKSINKQQEFKGWIVSNRGNQKIRFIVLNDGSSFQNLQLVIKNQQQSYWDQIIKLRIGSAIIVSGQLILTPSREQKFELQVKKVLALKNTSPNYPLQKQKISNEVLRNIPHLRHRTQLFKAIMLIRSSLATQIHAFFKKENFILMSSPIISNLDGEGVGNMFIVDDEQKSSFFNKKSNLGVTGQLHAEAYANGFGKVYTFAPTFRAEKSHTQKHIAEFWMIEPEIAFSDLKEIIKIAHNLLKFVIKKIFKENKLELEFLDKNITPGLIKKLNSFLKAKLVVLDYGTVISKLKLVKNRFKNKKIEFGLDLNTEHERYLTDELFKAIVVVKNYPKKIKAFYMYQNKDNKTVAAFDLLVPGVGELIGGSQRECDYQKLLTRVKELKMDQKNLQWYLNLRQYGQFMSSGFGLGFERLVMYVTGTENIRDSIPFPRTPNSFIA